MEGGETDDEHVCSFPKGAATFPSGAHESLIVRAFGCCCQCNEHKMVLFVVFLGIFQTFIVLLRVLSCAMPYLCSLYSPESLVFFLLICSSFKIDSE